jgi:hypothetical protein
MKEITFAKPAGFSFCNEAVGLVKRGDDYFALTSASNLVYQLTGGDKKVVNMAQVLKLADDESFKCFQAIGESFVAVTSKLKVLSFAVDFESNRVKNLKELPFKFAESLRGASTVRLHLNKSLLMISSGRFLFYFSSKENQFKILKLLNEDVLAVKFGGQTDDQMFILTNKTITIATLVNDNGSLSLKISDKVSVAHPLGLAKVGESLLILDTSGDICKYDIGSKRWKGKFALATSSKEMIEVQAFSVSGDNRLVLYSDKYAYVLRKEMDKVSYVLAIKEYDYIALEDEFLKLERSGDHLSSVGTIQSASYTSETQSSKFYRQESVDQLSILLSFMSKQLLKQKQIHSAKETVETLLNRLQLKTCVYHLPQFKKSILLFYSLVKDFTSVNRSSTSPALSVVKPRVVSMSEDGELGAEYRTPKKQADFATPFSRRRVSDATDSTPRLSFEDFQAVENKWDQEAWVYHNEPSLSLIKPKND